MTMQGYLRKDGRKGIRNYVAVAYLVECAHHVARAIATPFAEDGVQLIGFPGCYPNAYAQAMMEALCTHPNVGAVLLVSLGCEQMNRRHLLEVIEASGRPVSLLVIQKSGGTRATIEAGRHWLGQAIGAYAKSGTGPIMGMLRPGIRPPRPGLYFMDMVPDDEVKWGFANINDNATITEQIACGAHVTLFSTGRGSVVGSAISAVIKICANPETYRRLEDDMDVNAGRIIDGGASLEAVGGEIFELIRKVASGAPTKSESLGHQEFVLGYKSFEPLGPSCLPV